MTDLHFWVGGYTPTMDGTASGIGLLRASAGGALEFLGTAAETSSPSFLAAGAQGILYSTDEAGRVEAFRRGPEFTLESLGGQPTTGASPCHVSVTPDRLYVSNYGDGSIDVFPLTDDGRIGPVAQTLGATGHGPNPAQGGPHAHSTLVRGSTMMAADLGADRVRVYDISRETVTLLDSIALPPGAGPRDLLPIGLSTLLLGELDGGVYRLDERPRPASRGRAVKTWVDGDHAAALALDSTSRFVFTGLRGSNRIAVVRLADFAPVAAVSSAGDWPRHVTVVGERLFVANQLSHSVAAFAIDPDTGIPVLLEPPVTVASPTFLLPVL